MAYVNISTRKEKKPFHTYKIKFEAIFALMQTSSFDRLSKKEQRLLKYRFGYSGHPKIKFVQISEIFGTSKSDAYRKCFRAVARLALMERGEI